MSILSYFHLCLNCTGSFTENTFAREVASDFDLLTLGVRMDLGDMNEINNFNEDDVMKAHIEA